jgi:hypothetical protein
MLGNTATFSCTALQGTNKCGILKPDAEGYYDMVLGALNFYNSAGAFWPYEGSAKEIFKSSSSFMRRMAKGVLRGEYGHPKQDGMSMNQYALRLLEIYEEKVSHHIKEVRVDFNAVKDKNGNPCIAIMGKVKPCGPYGDYLQKQIDNKSENVCFSIRAITADERVRNVLHKELQQIVTWDYVNEGGLEPAQKYRAPSLESYISLEVTAGIAKSIAKVKEEQLEAVGAGMESYQSVQMLNDFMVQMGWIKEKPAYLRW